jgi:geranylgeranylglycerol-phosphate geranylgeranyltransferase
LGFLGIFALSASVLVSNDVFDLAIDRVNRPDRPLPSGLVTPQAAMAFSFVLAGFGFLAGALAGWTAFAVSVLVWAVGFLYNWRFKRAGLLGNLMVAFSVGMTFIYGGIVVGLPSQRIVWFFAAIAFLIDLGEEITGDALDAEGDRAAGSRSLAILYGPETAIRTGAVIFGLVIVLSAFPFRLGWLDRVYLWPLLGADAVILAAVIKLLDASKPDRRVYMRWIYLSMLGAMLAFLVIRLVR